MWKLSLKPNYSYISVSFIMRNKIIKEGFFYTYISQVFILQLSSSVDIVLFVTNADGNKNAGMTFLGQIKGAICPHNSLLTLAHVEEKGIRNQGPFPELSF